MGIQQHKSYKILLLGDSCQDIYNYGSVERMSPEAPVPLLKLEKTVVKNGMAKNVKENLEALGVQVDLFTNEEEILKERFIDINTNYHLLRVDKGEINSVSPLFDKVNSFGEEYDAVVISDYNKGFVRNKEIEYFSRFCLEKNIPLFVDSKKRDLSLFEGALIKINLGESQQVVAYPKKYELIVTSGEHGAIWNDEIFSTESVEVYDVCGAGDTFFAGFIKKYLETSDIKKAIAFANECAKITVTKLGTHSLSLDEVKEINNKWKK